MTQIHIIQRLAPGGIEQLVSSLARMADGAIRIFSLEGSVCGLAQAWPAIAGLEDRLEAFGKKPGLRPRLVTDLSAALRRHKPHSVVTHHAGPMLYGGLAARMAGVPALLHVEHDAWHYRSARARRLGKAALGILRPRMAAVSRRVAEEVGLRIGAEVEVIANGVDTDLFRPRGRAKARASLGLPQSARVIGAAGRLEAVKGFDLLLEAVPHLPEDVRVVIFGAGGELAALTAQAAALGISSRVSFAGLTGNMAEVLPALDVFCLPSRSEGLPLAVLEAQACGIPVVAHDVGGVSEGLCKESGRLVPAGDRMLLAEALTETLACAPAADPRDFVLERFSLDRTLAAYRAAGGRD